MPLVQPHARPYHEQVKGALRYMEESGEKCTVVFALIVTEPASECMCVRGGGGGGVYEPPPPPRRPGGVL